MTPYNYSFNQPNMVVDVNGADPTAGSLAYELALRMSAGGSLGDWERAMDYSGGGFGGYGGSGWSLALGGLSINYNSLSNGVHSFSFSAGRLTSYAAYDFQTVTSKYGTTYRFTDLNGNNNSDLVYAFGYGSNNYIIHANQFDRTKYEGSNWNVHQASGMHGMILEMNARSGNNQIDNLVIVAHGNAREIHFGVFLGEEETLSVNDYAESRADVRTFNALLGFMKSGSNLVFHSCHPGLELGPAMKGKIRGDVNVFLNRDYTTGGGKLQPGTRDVFVPGTEFVKFGELLTTIGPNGDYINGWMNVNSDIQYRNIIINKNGTITTLKK